MAVRNRAGPSKYGAALPAEVSCVAAPHNTSHDYDETRDNGMSLNDDGLAVVEAIKGWSFLPMYIHVYVCISHRVTDMSPGGANASQSNVLSSVCRS